jgi:type IV pilus assembly protein PilY1
MFPTMKKKSVTQARAKLAQAIGLSLLATIYVAPSLASIAIPTSPLQTGARVPPNIMFILDDSGSMADTSLDDPPIANITANGIDISLQAFPYNTLYYTPSKTYRPWKDAAGNYLPDTPETAAFGSTTLASGGTTDLSASDQTFYVPQPTMTVVTDSSQYYRYRLRSTGNGSVIDRCEQTFTTTWGWRNCVNQATLIWPSLPTAITRTPAQERANYANWYSYHRTRNKIAKAGASYAFSDLGEDIRVGFTTIWNRGTFNIPVGTDNGLFRDLTTPVTSNRTTWFNSLFNATAASATPLKTALRRTGQYYEDTSAAGPYGPEATASQLACRQNFAILTTDGYWNSDNSTEADGDSVAGPTVTGPAGATYTYAPVKPYTLAVNDTLADVAMRFWKRDLRTDLTNAVPTSTDDPAFWQHMTTFSISIGIKGTLNPTLDLPDITSGAKSWPNPVQNNITAIDDLWHTAVNGHGDFVVATSPEVFAAALKDALATITSRTGSNSNVSANSFSLSSSTRIYLAKYVSGQWTGELQAYPITAAGVGGTPTWSASSLIPAFGSRNILTWSGTTGTIFPTAAQTVALTTPVADYIRGDRSNERQFKTPQVAPLFRDRITVLGDIINSSPAYVPDTDTIYAGANDGMLHAFNAATGVEQFAYVPGGINLADMKTLSSYSSPAYDHRYFVDGPVVVSTRKQTPSNNYLVGALGRGGKGLFGLNVTAPSTFNSSKVLWEQAGDADMGQVINRPVIVKLNTGVNGILVSNGINSANDGAALFILNLTTGAVIKKIVPTGATGNNSLSAPRAIDSDGNGTVDYVYAGDLLGNVWKFDISSTSTASWVVANAGSPMFIAKDSLNNRQPITGSVSIALDPSTFDTWLFLGTGRYLTAGDPASTAVQTWYGLRDDGAVIANRSALKQRKIIALGTFAGKTVRGFESSVGGDMVGKKGWYIDLLTPPNPPGTAVGERMVGDPFVSGRTLFASSIIPSSDTCASGGTGFVNALDAFTGSSGVEGSDSPFDLNTSDVNNTGFSDDRVSDGAGGYLPIGSVDLGIFMPGNASVISDILVACGSLGSCGTARLKNPSNTGRISWREIIGD